MSDEAALQAPSATCACRRHTRRECLLACLLPWLFPACAARRTQSLSLITAFAVHILAALCGLLLIVLLLAWAGRANMSLHDLTERFTRILREIIREAHTAPGGLPAVLGISAAAILGGHILLALLLMPWGARNEPLRHSLRNSLRQTWLHTTHYAPAILLVGLSTIGLDRLQQNWSATHTGPPPRNWPQPPARPVISTSDPNYTKTMEQYNIAYQQWQRQVAPLTQQWSRTHTLWWNSRPWYLRQQDLVFTGLIFFSACWMLGSLLRGIGTPREVAAITRTPTCLACGYNLTTMPLEARCPECGRLIAASIGPAAQPGPPWEHRRTLGWFRAWRATGILTTRSADEAGRTLRLSADPRHHRLFLWLHLPLAIPIGAFGYFASACLSYGTLNFADRPDEFLAWPLATGFACAAGIFALTCLAAVGIGLWTSWRARRNVLPAAMSLACYLVPVLLAWQFIATFCAISFELLDRAVWFRAIPIRPIEVSIVVFFAIPNLYFATLYWRLMLRGTHGARYANV